VITITDKAFDPADALSDFAKTCPDAGGIVSFSGHVRPTSKSGEVKTLHLQAYSPMTEQGIETAIQDAKSRWSLMGLCIIHRTGDMAPGEPIVFVAAASAHRRAAFEAVDFLMDYLKTKAIFWKKETGTAGTQWIEPRPEQTLADRLSSAGHQLADRALVADDIPALRTKVQNWIDDPQIDVVITTGGTGLTGRDVTVEALVPLFEKTIDGFSVIFHQESYKTVGLSTLQSRAVAGLAKGTFIFCLPGSNGAVKDGWDKVISYQLDSRHKPCNLVEIMPRLMEV